MYSLIYDIGVCNGDDTAYYLKKASRVVAVEANPTLVKDAQERFAAEIQDGRLVLINKGIAPQGGILDFWVNAKFPEWSSFSRETAGREGHPLECIPIETISLKEIIRKHGMPDYLKVDIEAYDRYCVESLSSDNRPEYISIEFNELDLLDLLEQRGYNRFKCICQFTHRRLSCRIRPFYTYFEMMYNLAQQTHDFAQAAKQRCSEATLWSLVKDYQAMLGKGFPQGSSGPCGEETDGPWLTKREIVDLYQAVKQHTIDHRSTVPIWCDVHAKAIPN